MQVGTAGEDFDLAVTQSTPGLTSVDRTEQGLHLLKFKPVLVSLQHPLFRDQNFKISKCIPINELLASNSTNERWSFFKCKLAGPHIIKVLTDIRT